MPVIGFEWNQADDVVNHFKNPATNKSLILHDGQYKKYVSIFEGDMVKDDSWTEEGTLLRIPLNIEVKKVEVVKSI